MTQVNKYKFYLSAESLNRIFDLDQLLFIKKKTRSESGWSFI
jgi:hypothetical protein